MEARESTATNTPPLKMKARVVVPCENLIFGLAWEENSSVARLRNEREGGIEKETGISATSLVSVAELSPEDFREYLSTFVRKSRLSDAID